jgi:hypothetical protein
MGGLMMRRLLMKSLLIFLAGILVCAFLMICHDLSKNGFSFEGFCDKANNNTLVGFMLLDQNNEQDVTNRDRSSAVHQHASRGSNFSSCAGEGLYYSWEE